MLTSDLINSIIQKLISRPSKTSVLIFNSELALKKQKELKTLIKNLYIEETSYAVVGAFLQNIELNIFTIEELNILLSFDYSSINGSKIIPTDTLENLNTPYYDLNKTIINLSYSNLNTLNDEFKKLHSINKSLSLEYLVSYIVNQI